MAISLLIADDDELLRNLVREIFEENSFTVYEAEDGEEALELFWEHPDLSMVILDIMMPKMDGLAVLDEIREKSEVPVLMLTALGDSASELDCLRHGASDFVSKPFHYEILLERVKNLMRMTKAQDFDKITVGILEMNRQSHKVYVDGKNIVLNNKEYRLLEFLIMNQNIVLTRDRILDRIWGYDYEGDIRTIDTHIKMLRASLGKAGKYIKTIRGTGYAFEETL